MKRLAHLFLFPAISISLAGGCANILSTLSPMNPKLQNYTLDYQTPVEPKLQTQKTFRKFDGFRMCECCEKIGRTFRAARMPPSTSGSDA
jgi:hypothetical protein